MAGLRPPTRWPDIEAALQKGPRSIAELKKKLKMDHSTIEINLQKKRAEGKVVREEIDSERAPGKRRLTFQRRKKVVWRLV